MTVTADQDIGLDRTRFFIDGEWVDLLGSETRQALGAATGETLGTASLGTDADIDRAVIGLPRRPRAGLLQMYAELVKTMDLGEVRASARAPRLSGASRSASSGRSRLRPGYGGHPV